MSTDLSSLNTLGFGASQVGASVKENPLADAGNIGVTEFDPPLEEGMTATQFLAWRNPMHREGLAGYGPVGLQKSRTPLK